MRQSIMPQRGATLQRFIFYRFGKILPEIILIWSLFAGILGCAAQGGYEAVKLELQPQQVLIGDPISIRASGLGIGQLASLKVSGQDQFGNTWSSEASFRADAAGTIDTSRDAPAWTYQGKALPYLRMMESEEQDRLFSEAQRNGTPYLDAPSFLYSLEMQRDRVAEATIPVENSHAAFLLIGNTGDGVWPSDMLSQIAIDRLRAHDHPRPYQLLSYDQGGHMLIPYPYYPTTMRQFYLPTIGIWEGLGGTAEGAAKAAEDSWPRVMEFLERELRS